MCWDQCYVQNAIFSPFENLLKLTTIVSVQAVFFGEKRIEPNLTQEQEFNQKINMHSIVFVEPCPLLLRNGQIRQKSSP
jgi:hypothetical protein